MGIRLDWEVESEAGWSEVGEDAAALAARKRRNRRLRTAGLVLLTIIAIVGGTMGWRLYSIGRQLRADLKTIVEIETRSLREGKRSTFLSMQAEYEEWQREQSRTFDDYQLLEDRIQVNGKIVNLEITADLARVVVEEIFNGKPYHVTWFYQHTEDGWRHIPPNPNQWGAQASLETVHFRISYHAEDEALARRLAVQVDEWWDAACRITDCVDDPVAPQIRIEPDPLVDMGWASYDSDVLIIPSPGLGRVPADGSDDPTLFPTVARYLAGYWADSTVFEQFKHPELEYSQAQWLRDELAIYVNHRFDDSVPRSGFFNPLAEDYGTEIVRQILEQMPSNEELFSFPDMLEEITGTPAEQLNVDWGTYLAQRLRRESSLVSRGFLTEARLIYGGGGSGRDEGGPIVNFPTEVAADPASIELLSVRKSGEMIRLVWIEVRFTLRTAEGGSYIAFEPYRLFQGQWRHESVVSADWGEVQTEESQYISLNYTDLDASYAEGLAPYLERQYLQAARDFGVDTNALPGINVTIIPTTFTHPSGNDIMISSLYAAGYDPAFTSSSYVQTEVGWRLIANLLTQRVPMLPINHPISASFIIWEMDRSGLNGQAALTGLLDEYGPVSARFLVDQSNPLSFIPPYEDTDYAKARALLDVLVNRYGERAVPTLLDNLYESSSVDDWLIRSFDISFASIQADWEAALNR
jgi:hypothetical protein